jgi:DNA (cytosine-5)-methyltransferase 1
LRANAGDNQMAVAYTLKIRSGCDVDSAGKAAGKGPLVQVDKAATLATTQDQHLFAPTYALDQPVYCLQGNGIDRADTAGCNGKGVKEDICYTLNTIDRPAVASQTYQKVSGPLMANSHPGGYTGQDAFSDMLVAGEANPVHYIVRRLTPTECARLQGFADRWGDIDEQDSFTPEEYEFWLNVRNTHAAINGRAAKDYTEAQMLTWYNKLRTDSAEYKMWGNGIALPPALYCMQGISDVLHKEDEDA